MGRTFLPYSLARVVRIRKTSSIPVIGVGGIGEPQDLIQYLLCGTPLAGVGSALYFHGPTLLDRLHKGLSNWMGEKGYTSVKEFLGRVFPLIRDPMDLVAREKHPHTVPPDCPYAPVVDTDACRQCGRCERACIYGVLRLNRETGALEIDASRCWSCGFCVGICPEGALALVDRTGKAGIVWNNQGTAIPFR
jgi:ferredoxin